MKRFDVKQLTFAPIKASFAILSLLLAALSLLGLASIAHADGPDLSNWAGSSPTNNLWFDPTPGDEFQAADAGRTFYSSSVNFKIVSVILNYDMTAQGEGVHNVVKVTNADGSNATVFQGVSGLAWNFTSPRTTATPGDLNKIEHLGDSIAAGYNETAGPPGQFEQQAYALQGRTITTVLEEAVSGTATSDWLPGGQYLPGAITAATNAGVGTVEIHLGRNDQGRDHATVSTFISNMTTIINAVLDPATGVQKVVVTGITAGVPGGFTGQPGYVSAAGEVIIQQYNAALPGLAAANPNVTVKALNAYGFFQLHPQRLGDGLHPDNQGAKDLGYLWAGAAPPDALSTFGLTVATALSPPAYTWVSGSLVTTPGPAVFTVTPLGGTGTITYTLTRPGMTAVTSTTGILTDTTIVPGMLNSYTITATDSAATPLTQAVAQAVVPIGAYTAPVGTSTVTYLTPGLTHNVSLQPVLAWPADSTATGYKVMRSTDGITYTVITTLAAGTLTYTDVSRPIGGTCHYLVETTH